MGHGHHHHHASEGLEKNVVKVTVGISLLLVALKFYGWIVTDSLSLFSSLVDSTMDVASTMMNGIAIYYAHKPADDDHPYGHTSIEDIAGLTQAAFICGSAAFIVFEAISRFISPAPIEASETGILIIGISLVLNGVLCLYQRYAIRKTKSVVLEADSLHYLSDFLSGAVLIAMMIGAQFSWFPVFADPLLACVIAGYLIYGAAYIGTRSYHNLMDRVADPETHQTILSTLSSHPGINGAHEIRTRISGRKLFIQAHIELDPDLPLREAHEITEAAQQKLLGLFPLADVILHTDPGPDK